MSEHTQKEYRGLGTYYTFYSQANSTSPQCPLVTSIEGKQGSGKIQVLGASNPFPCLWYWWKSGKVASWFRVFDVYQWDGVSGKKTQFPRLITGLYLEGHSTVEFMPQYSMKVTSIIEDLIIPATSGQTQMVLFHLEL